MKTICEKCNRIINTNGELKGQHAYHYSISFESEPYINCACPEEKTGYLCFDCQRELKKFFRFE